MTRYEYKVVPAAQKGQKSKGVKTAEARFAFALEAQINALAQEGWEYQRAEMLPSQERAGLTGSTTEWRHMLIFRRVIAEEAEASLLPSPIPGAEDETDEPAAVDTRSDNEPAAQEVIDKAKA